MLVDMAEQTRRVAKIIVNTRIDPENVAKLDEIAETIRPRPSRSEMVDLAVSEYVQQHHPGTSKKKAK